MKSLTAVALAALLITGCSDNVNADKSQNEAPKPAESTEAATAEAPKEEAPKVEKSTVAAPAAEPEVAQPAEAPAQEVTATEAPAPEATETQATDTPAQEVTEPQTTETPAQEVTEPTEAPAQTLTLTQQVSYIYGYNNALQIKAQSEQMGMGVDGDEIIAGIRDAMNGSQSRYSAEETQRISIEFQKVMQAKMQERMAQEQADLEKQRAANQAISDAFLAENANKDGVVVTTSGLQYKELVAGDGPIPTANDTVTVHYKGTLADGRTFDSSYDRGEPATFPVQGVIAGWIEALQMMNVGDKWQLVIPPQLGYGERGAGEMIGPGSVLVFEVELLSIEPKS